jgi:hypothetical protein
MKHLLIAALVLICGAARAATIVIDPDQFSVGTDLSHLFPVVTLTNGYGDPVDATLSPAPALDPNVFGVGSQNAFGYFVSPPGPNSPPLVPDAGFSFVAQFNQPIASATFRRARSERSTVPMTPADISCRTAISGPLRGSHMTRYSI